MSKRFTDRLLIGCVAILACIGVTLMVIGFGGVGKAATDPTATPKKNLSTILKVSPIGTEPATRVPVTAQPMVIQTASPTAGAVKSATIQSVATTTGQGGYVCPNDEACVKGNINSDGVKLYHLPVGCPSYKSTVIKTEDGERMFTSEAEAIAAGWKKSPNCN